MSRILDENFSINKQIKNMYENFPFTGESYHTIKLVRISPPEFSFNNSFSNDFAIGKVFGIDRVANSIINGSILSLEAFGNLKIPKISYLQLTGIPTGERLGTNFLDYLYLYSTGEVLYVVGEAKYNRLEKVAIKNVIVQKITSKSSLVNTNYEAESPYRTWSGGVYSILYKDTLGRIWEEKELTRDPESFFDWYIKSQGINENKKTKVVSIKSLGRRKKNVDWKNSRLFSKRMAEKGILQRIKIKKASIKKGNMLVYFDEKDNSWAEEELVFETMANMLIKNFKNQSKR